MLLETSFFNSRGASCQYLTIKASILQLFSCMNQLPFQSNLKVDQIAVNFSFHDFDQDKMSKYSFKHKVLASIG